MNFKKPKIEDPKSFQSRKENKIHTEEWESDFPTATQRENSEMMLS